MNAQINSSFIQYAADTLAATDGGLTGSEIVKQGNRFAILFNREIPHTQYPFNAPNKRTALFEILDSFNGREQYQIIKSLCELYWLKDNTDVKTLRTLLLERYTAYAPEGIQASEIVQKTQHWLENYPDALYQYECAIKKFEAGIYERNCLDDLRLSFELLVKDLLSNQKALENQISDIGKGLKESGVPAEMRNMIVKVIEYFTKYQNDHVKHNDLVNTEEIETIIEITSVLMKYLIRTIGRKN